MAAFTKKYEFLSNQLRVCVFLCCYSYSADTVQSDTLAMPVAERNARRENWGIQPSCSRANIYARVANSVYAVRRRVFSPNDSPDDSNSPVS